MSTPDQESVMSRVMKLLSLANDQSTTKHERELAEERAQKLMDQHMIDRFEAEQAAKRNHHQVRKPIQDTWEIVMSAYKSETSDWRSDMEFDEQIINMVQYVLKHCNVKMHPKFEYAHKDMGEQFGVRRKVQDPYRRIYKIVGYPEDIAYAERIWFNVFKTFVSNVNPQWDVDQPIGYNAYNFASAGVAWKDQVLLAEAAKDDRLAWPWRYQDTDPDAPAYIRYSTWGKALGEPQEKDNKPWGQSIHKLKRACKQYCIDENLTYPYAGGTKLRVESRNSFARSYRATICSRLDEIRRKAQQGEEHVDSNKFAVALRDTKESVDAEFYRLFPEYDPEVRRKMRDAAEFEAACEWASLSEAEQEQVLKEQAADEERWAKAARRSRRNYGTVREDPAERYDSAAWSRGRDAANTVNLRNDAEVGDEDKQAINTTRRAID